MMKKVMAVWPLAALFLACEGDTGLESRQDLIVVRAYIYAHEPVADIQITRTLSLGSEATSAPPVNDAQVSLVKSDKTYNLVASPGDSGYYHYPGADLHIETGDKFTIQVTHNSLQSTGTTTVPKPPAGVSLSNDTLFIRSGYPFGPGGNPGAPGENPGGIPTDDILEVTWDEDSEALFYLMVENLEDTPVQADSLFPDFMRPARFVSSPTNLNRYSISGRDITHLGRHRIKVYRVNQEYADLYSTRQQDSRDLNEPLSNIENGLGIFSAFNSTEAYFEAVEESDE